MRNVAFLVALAFVAVLQGPAFARTMRVPCEDRITTRCEPPDHRGASSASIARDDARQGRTSSHRASHSSKPDPKETANRKARYQRVESDEIDLINDTYPIIMASRVAADDAANWRASGSADFSSRDAAGFAPWSNVLVLILGGAGMLSLLLAKAADA